MLKWHLCSVSAPQQQTMSSASFHVPQQQTMVSVSFQGFSCINPTGDCLSRSLWDLSCLETQSLYKLLGPWLSWEPLFKRVEKQDLPLERTLNTVIKITSPHARGTVEAIPSAQICPCRTPDADTKQVFKSVCLEIFTCFLSVPFSLISKDCIYIYFHVCTYICVQIYTFRLWGLKSQEFVGDLVY